MVFNKTKTGKNIVKNIEGGKAYKMSAEMELYSLVCTSMVSDPKYTSSEDFQRLTELVSKCNPEFVVKLAVYARTKMNLRTIPLVLTVVLAKVHKGDNLVSNMVQGVVKRADEITELLAFYQVANQRTGTKKLGKLSNQIQKGIKKVFEANTFNEYQLQKYNRKTEVTLRDALFLTHPKPVDANQKDLFEKIINDTLETPYTWETQLSEAGKVDSPLTTKKDVWEELIDSGKVGYMALLRNLRNIIDADVSPEHIGKVAKRIADPEQVRNSKQFPFRFLSAYRSLAGTAGNTWMMSRRDIDYPPSLKKDAMVRALEKAIRVSVENVSLFDDENESQLIAMDVSASMMGPVSPKSTVENYDIGVILGLLASSKLKNSTVGMFGDSWKPLIFKTNNILEESDNIRKREGEVGYTTNGWRVLDWAITNERKFDRILFFTDEQMWNSSYTNKESTLSGIWNKYKRMFPESKIYIFDLRGMGKVPIDLNQKDVYKVSGWSDKIFEAINNLEKGDDILKEVNKIVI